MRIFVIFISIIICISYLVDKPGVIINPAGFESIKINGNQYFPLKPGTIRTYEGKCEDGALLRYEEMVTSQTKNIMGISCREVAAKAYKNNELVFEVCKLYATDKKTNVWQFGRESKQIEDGEIIGTTGSWHAGLNDLRPIIVVWANPHDGFFHQQTFSPNANAEMAQVFSFGTNIFLPEWA